MAKKRIRTPQPQAQEAPQAPQPPPQPPQPQAQEAPQPPQPPQPPSSTQPPLSTQTAQTVKRIKHYDMNPLLRKYFMTVIGSCVRFSLMHYNAEEHICAYATELHEREPMSERSAICSWLADMQEVD